MRRLCCGGKVQERADDHKRDQDKRAGQEEEVHREDFEFSCAIILPVIPEDECKDGPHRHQERQKRKKEKRCDGNVNGELSEQGGNHCGSIISCIGTVHKQRLVFVFTNPRTSSII